MMGRGATAARRRANTNNPRGMSQGLDALRWQSDARLAANWADYARLRIGFCRVDISWTMIQPDNESTYDWVVADRLINGMAAAGLSPLCILIGAPEWARLVPGNGSSPPADNAKFATFCAAVVNRYKDRVKHWEIWNEPNLDGFWGPTPDPVAYTNLLKAASPAIRAADPNAFIISGGLSPVPDPDEEPPTNYLQAIPYLQAIYDNGGGPHFDAVGYHPYSYPLMPSNTDNWNGWYMMFGTTPSIRSVMIANGDTNKKLWMTEFGAPTNSPNGGAVTEQFQSDMMTEAYALAATYPWAGPVLWYAYRDNGTNTADNEDWFGLISESYVPKIAYTTLAQMTRPGLAAANRKFQQGVSSYAGTVDTRVQQSTPTTSYATATSTIIDGQSGAKIQGLLRFDSIFGAGGTQVPLGATIVLAEVRLEVTVAGHGPSFHRMVRSWTAADTWDSLGSGIQLDGVDAVAETPLSDYWWDVGTNLVDVTKDIQAWSNGAANNGWLIESTGDLEMTFLSSEGATPPLLIVTYTVS